MKTIAFKFILGYILMFPLINLNAQVNNNALHNNHRLYDSLVSGIHIFPGIWRPVFKTEQIAWVNPPWLNKGFIWADFPKATDFIWLDFPKAIFSGNELFFLSHINPNLPARYNYPQVVQKPWNSIAGGIQYRQQLPNGLKFGGAVKKESENVIALEGWLKNDSDSVINNILFLTCAFLHPIEEFNEKSNDNKFIHIKDIGWVTLAKALKMKGNKGKYSVGWGGGSQKIADLPVIVVASKVENHLMAYTWWDNTAALWGNDAHPSFNADPYVPDLLPGMEYCIKGNLFFFEGNLQQFETFFKKELLVRSK